MHTVKKLRRGRAKFDEMLEKYNYQPKLTPELDKVGSGPFDQNLVNKIVLWKVNRYATLPPELLAEFNDLAALAPGSYKQAKAVLEKLLADDIRGIDLPMASALLRFRNPAVFQIIDQHAYRAVYGKKYPFHAGSKSEKKIECYFKYLDDLVDLGRTKGWDFRDLDRFLYRFDKEKND